MSLQNVLGAQPYSPMRLNSIHGDAEYMLVRQRGFPAVWDGSLDVLHSVDHDRLPIGRVHEVCDRHLGTGPIGIHQWARSDKATTEKLLAFCRDMHGASELVTMPDGTDGTWTGCRVMVSLHCATGHWIFTLELFAKHPDSDTEVHSRDRAPNVCPDGWLGSLFESVVESAIEDEK